MELFSSKLFESVNGTLFFAIVGLLIIFGKFLRHLWAHPHLWSRPKRRPLSIVEHWRGFHAEAAPAIALVALIFGDAMIRGPVWLSRWMANHHVGNPAFLVNYFVPVILTGVIVSLVGAWCIARVYGSRLDGLVAVLVSLLLGVGLAWPW